MSNHLQFGSGQRIRPIWKNDDYLNKIYNSLTRTIQVVIQLKFLTIKLHSVK